MTISGQCITCAHFRFSGECDAFDKIPTAIFTGEFDHRKAYPGDKGIRWVRMRPVACASTPVSTARPRGPEPRTGHSRITADGSAPHCD